MRPTLAGVCSLVEAEIRNRRQRNPICELARIETRLNLEVTYKYCFKVFGCYQLLVCDSQIKG